MNDVNPEAGGEAARESPIVRLALGTFIKKCGEGLGS